MGLDQYLSIRKYIPRLEWGDYTDKPTETLQFRQIAEVSGMREFVNDDGYTGAYIEVPTYYWRKANWLHNYIIENHAGGVDECQPIELSPGDLRDLVDLCGDVLANKNKASALLPTSSGFFFGSTEYDDWYYESIEDTFVGLGKLLDKLDEGEHYPVYQASW